MSHVDGVDDGVGYGVSGKSNSGDGVHGSADRGLAVVGESNSGYGVIGASINSDRVRGISLSSNHAGVVGENGSGVGVAGYSSSGTGVYGSSLSSSGYGVVGRSYRGIAIYGLSTYGIGIYGHTDFGGDAAYLDGNVRITGTLQKGGGQFKIDHPLDPANKYLCHFFVESPDMKNIYDGVVVLDNKGEAEIELPDWFSALNQDFRYQLTAIGSPGPNLYIAEKISDSNTSNKNNNSRFKIAGGTSGMEVSWQVTGIRKDPWANANRIEVEEEKPDKERGYYLHPDLYGQPEEKGMSHLLFPKDKREELARPVIK